MAAILLAFFGLVVAVNVTMAVFATSTFGGVVVENSYVASQKYNGWLEAAKRQEKLGWKVAARLDDARHVIISANVEGAEVSGFARHPVGRERDVPLRFGRDLRSDVALPAGRWAVHLLVRKNGHEARLIEVLS